MKPNHNGVNRWRQPDPHLQHQVSLALARSHHARSVEELAAVIEDLKRENRELQAMLGSRSLERVAA